MEETKVPLLIDEVQRRPSIWNKTLSEYRSKNFVGTEWDKVASSIRVSKAQAQNKWKALVKKFKTEHSRVQFHRSGDGLDDCYESKWPYYTSLSFLGNCVVPNSSSGNLDSSFDVKPSLKSELNQESESQVIDLDMYKKQNDIAEQILRMENQKYALLEKSLNNHPQSDNIAEQDKLNMAFFETLLPTLREVSKEDILLCRTDISRVIFNYAYKGTAWKSLSDCTNAVKQNSLVQPKKHRLNEDDDCQIISCFAPSPHWQPNRPIKIEKKYTPTASERDIERRSCNNAEITTMRPGYDRWTHPSRAPSNWNSHPYEQQVPRYPEQRYFHATENQNWHSHGSIPRQIPINIANPSTDNTARIHYTSMVSQPTALSEAPIAANINVVSSENIFPNQQGEFQNTMENQYILRQIPATLTQGFTEGSSNTSNKITCPSTVTQPINISSQAPIRTNISIVNSERLFSDPQSEFQANKENLASGFENSVGPIDSQVLEQHKSVQ